MESMTFASSGYLLGLGTGLSLGLAIGINSIKGPLKRSIEQGKLLVTDQDGKDLTPDEVLSVFRKLRLERRNKG